MKCADFSPQEQVKANGKMCKVISSSKGWVTVVPVDKCKTLSMILENEIKLRPDFVLKVENNDA